MAINCSSNALLDTLNAKKDLLNSKVASLQSAGAAAMGDLKAKADAMKDSLLASIPVPPAIPNFKKELDALKGKVGKELADAKAAFKARWGGALPDIDIDGLMSSATSLIPKPDFDFCKDVPNIEAPSVSADGVVEEVKVKAEVPIVAADIPKKVEVVVPTVVEKEKAPSSSLVVTKPVATIASAEADMRREIDAFLLPYRERKIAAGQKQVHVTLQKDWEKVTKVTQSEGYTLEDYYNNQLGKPAQRALVREWFVHDIEIKNMVLIINSCLSVNKIQSSGFSGKAYAIEELKQIVNFNYARLDADSVDGDDTVLNRVTLRGFDKIIDDYVALLAKHAEVLRDIRNYKTV